MCDAGGFRQRWFGWMPPKEAVRDIHAYTTDALEDLVDTRVVREAVEPITRASGSDDVPAAVVELKLRWLSELQRHATLKLPASGKGTVGEACGADRHVRQAYDTKEPTVKCQMSMESMTSVSYALLSLLVQHVSIQQTSCCVRILAG